MVNGKLKGCGRMPETTSLIDGKHISKAISAIAGFFMFFFGLGLSKNIWLYSWDYPTTWGCSMAVHVGTNRLNPSDVIYRTPSSPYVSPFFDTISSGDRIFLIIAFIGLLLIILSAMPKHEVTNKTYKVIEIEELKK